jgi:DNA end-binding protein Ku
LSASPVTGLGEGLEGRHRQYIEVSKDELEKIALESTRTIDINEFVPKSSIDPGKVGHDAFAVIRETIRNMDMVAIGRVVLTSREHIILGTLLRYRPMAGAISRTR